MWDSGLAVTRVGVQGSGLITYVEGVKVKDGRF